MECRKVTFSDQNIVHNLCVWSFAYNEARKGKWHLYSVDRYRFIEKIKKIEDKLEMYLTASHRNKIYTERFYCIV